MRTRATANSWFAAARARGAFVGWHLATNCASSRRIRGRHVACFVTRDAMKVRSSICLSAAFAALCACASPDAVELAGREQAILNGHAADDDERWGTIGIRGYFKPEKGRITGWICTGTLVQPDLIVTAAHCLYEPSSLLPGKTRLRATHMIVVAGSSSIDRTDDDEEFAVASMISYPGGLDEVESDDDAGLGGFQDIALIRTEKAIEQVDTMNILPEADFDASLSPGSEITISGYGRRVVDEYGVSTEDGLLYVGTATFQRRSATEFLAGGEEGDESDTCPGDSGGPVYMERDGETFLVGATSRGRDDFSSYDCGKGGVYTIVPAYQGWIDETASSDALGDEAWTPEFSVPEPDEDEEDDYEPPPGGGLTDDQQMPLEGGKLEFCSVSRAGGRPGPSALFLVIAGFSLLARRRIPHRD
jgi:V8-like Glu-specific endopeptidase